MTPEKCFHVQLDRKLVGNSAYYKCAACGQKFLPHSAGEPLTPWDGKVKVSIGK